MTLAIVNRVRFAAVLAVVALQATGRDDTLEGRAARHVESLQPAVEAALGSPLARPVPVSVVGSDIFRARFDHACSTPEAQRRLCTLRVLRARLRLPSVSTDTSVSVRDVSALYARDSGAILLSNAWAATDLDPQLRLTILHELVHAHRDQAGLYAKASSEEVADEDQELALRCLVEGDAVFVTVSLGEAAALHMGPTRAMAYVANLLTSDDPADVLRANEMLKRYVNVSGPEYWYGPRYVANLFASGGTEGVANAFRNPPKSTAQVLHSTRTHRVVFAGGRLADQDGLCHIGSGVIGEIGMRCMLATALSEREAASVTGGWNGCLYHVYQSENGRGVVAMITTWKSEVDAVRFAHAWCDWAGRRDGSRAYEVKTELVAAGEQHSMTVDGGAVHTCRREREVVVIDGGAGGQLVALAKALWDADRSDE